MITVYVMKELITLQYVFSFTFSMNSAHSHIDFLILNFNQNKCFSQTIFATRNAGTHANVALVNNYYSHDFNTKGFSGASFVIRL